jgi:hypothetical protein
MEDGEGKRDEGELKMPMVVGVGELFGNFDWFPMVYCLFEAAVLAQQVNNVVFGM